MLNKAGTDPCSISYPDLLKAHLDRQRAAERLGIPRSEFIRQACRTFITTMNGAPVSERHASPKKNESSDEPLSFFSSSGTGF
jgi:hypothetical protein